MDLSMLLLIQRHLTPQSAQRATERQRLQLRKLACLRNQTIEIEIKFEV